MLALKRDDGMPRPTPGGDGGAKSEPAGIRPSSRPCRDPIRGTIGGDGDRVRQRALPGSAHSSAHGVCGTRGRTHMTAKGDGKPKAKRRKIAVDDETAALLAARADALGISVAELIAAIAGNKPAAAPPAPDDTQTAANA